ncbi:DNA ligase 1-like isoform X2 [Patella vulgata]|uniref:DNA ligase 1-like isoform X2 n=1 Tax=Patella vulgata TaxID=6465 RepID=UPI0024A96DA5|nr:DNA ligase 1-like isoform X2 [Patella vulgata]
MEAVEELRSWWKVPCIAHFCSLFRGVLFEQSDLDIEDLEEALIAATSPCDSPIILDLLCSLLEGIYGREQLTVVDYDRYMKDLFRHHHDAGHIKTNPLVDKTYFELSLHDKVEVLHNLCDFRLDAEDVMEVLKGHDGDNMRVEPLGHDLNGATYWYFYGTRLYQEDPSPKDPKEKEKLPRHVKHSKKSKRKKKTEREERAEKRRSKKKDASPEEKPRELRASPKLLRKSKCNTKKSLIALENEEQTGYDNEDEGFEENYNQEEELSEGTKTKSAFVNDPLSKGTQESANADAVDNSCVSAEEIKSTVTNTLSDIKVKIEKNEFATKKETLADRVSEIIGVKAEDDKKISERKEEDIIDGKNKIETTDIKHKTTDAKGIHVEVKDEIKDEVQCEADEKVKAEVDKVVNDVIHEVEKQNDNRLTKKKHEEAVPEPEEAAMEPEKTVPESEKAVPKPDEAVLPLGEIEPEYEEVIQEFEVETANKDDENENGDEKVVEKEANDMELLDDSPASIEDSKSEDEKPVEVIEPRHVSRWHMVCSTLEDWQNLSEFFRESEAKCEKALYRTIVEDFLPEIPNIIIEREKELTRRLMQSMPRRQSSRLEVKRIQQEELEKLQAQQEAEEEKQKAIEDDKRMERVRQARVEDQKKAREERERVREENWNFGNPWLRIDVYTQKMFCSICENSKVTNSFTSGCSVLKKESIDTLLSAKECFTIQRLASR